MCSGVTLGSVSQVTVMFAGQQIPKSPFEVTVDKALGDASKVMVKGPGIEPVGVVANNPTYFDIYTAGQKLLGEKKASARAGCDVTDPPPPAPLPAAPTTPVVFWLAHTRGIL